MRRRRVVGTVLAVTDYEEAMDVMDGLVARGEPGYVCAVAVHAVMLARRDPELRRALENASLVVPDGMPLVWAANALGEHMLDRVYGPELMWRYCGRCAERGHRVFLYGGRDDETLAELVRRLRSAHPGIDVVGTYSPPFRPLTATEEAEVLTRIHDVRPDVLWVGIGAPKQEKWMARMRPRLKVPVLCGVGAAFDFHAGRVPQAPPWMQRRGLEWSYRLAQEPRRLLPRYLVHNPGFVLAFARQLAGERLLRPRREDGRTF